MRKPGAEDIRKAVRKTSKKKRTDEGTSSTPPAPKRLQIGPATGGLASPVPERLRADSAARAVTPPAPRRPRVDLAMKGPAEEVGAAPSEELSFQFDGEVHILDSPPQAEASTSGTIPALTSAGASDAGPSQPSHPNIPGPNPLEVLSALEDPAVAISAFKSIMLPADVQMLSNWTKEEIVGSGFTALIQVIHSNLWMKQQNDRDVQQRDSLREQVNNLSAEKKSAEGKLAAAEERMKKLAEERDAAVSKAEELTTEARTQALRVSDVESDLAIMKADLEAAVTARASLQNKLADKEIEVAGGVKKLDEASSRLAEQKLLLQSFSDKVKTLEEEVEATRTSAVESFKNSEAFTESVAESSADSYRLGFADCKEAISKSFPSLDLATIRPPGEEESTEEEEENVERTVAEFADEVIEALRTDEGDNHDELASVISAPGEVLAQLEEAAPPQTQSSAEPMPPECNV